MKGYNGSIFSLVLLEKMIRSQKKDSERSDTFWIMQKILLLKFSYLNTCSNILKDYIQVTLVPTNLSHEFEEATFVLHLPYTAEVNFPHSSDILIAFCKGLVNISYIPMDNTLYKVR